MEEKYFRLDCVITELLARKFKIKWLPPLDPDNHYENIKKHQEEESEEFEFWFTDPVNNRKSWKSLQVMKGKVKGLAIARSLLVGKNITLDDIKDCT